MSSRAKTPGRSPCGSTRPEEAVISAMDRRQIHARLRCRSKQDGVAAVEFAIVAVVFFLIVFGIIEFARAMYMYNTLAEVTRNAAEAATNISFNDQAGLDLARKRAVLDEKNGKLPFGSPITYQNVRIEYMYLPPKAFALQIMSAASLPTCPASNRVNCMTDPNGISCIRAVQARICKEDAASDTCTPVDYESLIPLIKLPLLLPTSPTIVTAESLGYKTGDAPCS
jgi:hypothetical protein